MYELVMNPKDPHGLDHKPVLRCYACNQPITSIKEGMAAWPREYDELGTPLPTEPNLVHTACVDGHIDRQDDRWDWERMPLTTFFNLLLRLPVAG